MVPAYSAFDIVEIASQVGRDVDETAEVYFDLADRLQISRLRDRITALPREDRWNTMARGALRDDLYTAHAALAKDVLTVTTSGTPEERLAAWVARNESAVARANQTLVEIWESDCVHRRDLVGGCPGNQDTGLDEHLAGPVSARNAMDLGKPVDSRSALAWREGAEARSDGRFA